MAKTTQGSECLGVFTSRAPFEGQSVDCGPRNWKAAFLFFGSSQFGFSPHKSSSAMRADPPQIYHLIPRAATRLAKEANRPCMEPHPVFLSRGKGVKQGRDNADNALVIAAVSVTTTRAAADVSPLCMQPLLMVQYVWNTSLCTDCSSTAEKALSWHIVSDGLSILLS